MSTLKYCSGHISSPEHWIFTILASTTVTLFAYSLKNDESKNVHPWLYVQILRRLKRFEHFWSKNGYLPGPLLLTFGKITP
jgi:hypothetical protein